MFDALTASQRFIPILTVCVLDCRYPRKIKRVPGDLKFAHCRVTKLCFRYKFRPTDLDKIQQPVATAPSFSLRSFR